MASEMIDLRDRAVETAQCDSRPFEKGGHKGRLYFQLDVPSFNHGGGDVAYKGQSSVPCGALRNYTPPSPPSGSHSLNSLLDFAISVTLYGIAVWMNHLTIFSRTKTACSDGRFVII